MSLAATRQPPSLDGLVRALMARWLYTKTKEGGAGQAEQRGDELAGRVWADESSRIHLPWQWAAVNVVHLVVRSMVPWPAHRYPSDGRIARLSHRTHTLSPATTNEMRRRALHIRVCSHSH